MSANKLTKTLDSISDKAFGFKDKPSAPNHSAPDETAPFVAYDEDKTETLSTSHGATAVYPVVEHPVDENLDPEKPAAHLDAEPAPEDHREQPVCAKPFIPNQKPFPQRQVPNPPSEPPFQHQNKEGHAELKTGPEQDFTVATVAGFMGILCLLMMFSHQLLGLIAIAFGATAVYFARKTERAGIDAGIGKTLGYVSFFGGIVLSVLTAFVLFIAFVCLAMR